MDPTSPAWREVAGKVSAHLAEAGLLFSLSSNAAFESPFWTLKFEGGGVEGGVEIHMWCELELLRVAMPIHPPLDDASLLEFLRSQWQRPYIRLAVDQTNLQLLTTETPLDSLSPKRVADMVALCLRAREAMPAKGHETTRLTADPGAPTSDTESLMRVMFMLPRAGEAEHWQFALELDVPVIPRIGESVTLDASHNEHGGVYRVVDVWHAPESPAVAEVYLRPTAQRVPPMIDAIEPYTVIRNSVEVLHRVSGTFALPVGASIELPNGTTVKVKEVRLAEYSKPGEPSHVVLVVD